MRYGREWRPRSSLLFTAVPARRRACAAGTGRPVTANGDVSHS